MHVCAFVCSLGPRVGVTDDSRSTTLRVHASGGGEEGRGPAAKSSLPISRTAATCDAQVLTVTTVAVFRTTLSYGFVVVFFGLRLFVCMACVCP